LKVAVSATEGSPESTVDPRFGRCPYYVIMDTETMASEILPNTSMGAPSGAGIGAAQIVAGRGVEAVLTGSVGPNASAVLSQAGIKIVTGVQGTVREAVEAYKGGSLETAPATGYGQGSLYGGRGAGRGMGMGRGMGRGLGMGRGMGMYPYQPQAPAQPQPPPTSKKQEIEMLTGRMEQLEGQLKELKKRLKELSE
jgi:predicted Fe-Mo cluster-binding NifX family protein